MRRQSPFPRLIGAALGLERLVNRIGGWAAWLAPAMMLVIVADVVLRKFFVIGSVMLQELEWHLHGALFLLCLGFAYMRGIHVRVELIWDRWRPRTRAWIELTGLVFCLLPFCLAIVKFGFDYAAMSWENREVSASMTGLGARWIIKSILVAGVGLLTLSGISALIRIIACLTGRRELIDEADIAALLRDSPHSS